MNALSFYPPQSHTLDTARTVTPSRTLCWEHVEIRRGQSFGSYSISHALLRRSCDKVFVTIEKKADYFSCSIGIGSMTGIDGYHQNIEADRLDSLESFFRVLDKLQSSADKLVMWCNQDFFDIYGASHLKHRYGNLQLISLNMEQFASQVLEIPPTPTEWPLFNWQVKHNVANEDSADSKISPYLVYLVLLHSLAFIQPHIPRPSQPISKEI